MLREDLSSWFRSRSYTNWNVQLQRIGRGLKFRVYEVEGLYYLYSENKDADQLCAADLRFCFSRIHAKAGFLMTWLIYKTYNSDPKMTLLKIYIKFVET